MTTVQEPYITESTVQNLRTVLRFPERDTDFPFCKTCRSALATAKIPIQRPPKTISPVVNRPCSQVDHPPPPFVAEFNPLTPNDTYRGRTASLTSKRCILYMYSTNIGTEYFKHDIYSPCFSLQNTVFFIILMYLVHVLFTFYIQGVLKLKKNNSGAKRLRNNEWIPYG